MNDDEVAAIKAQGIRELADMWEQSMDLFAYVVTDEDRKETAAWVKSARLFADAIERGDGLT